MQGFTIGEVAKKVNVSRDAIRLYELHGLIPKPERTPNGYRYYSEDVVLYLRFIQRAKNMGFTLKEIGELLSIKHDKNHTCEKIRSQAQGKLNQVEKKITELKILRKALQCLIQTCVHNRKINACPLLDELEPGTKRGAK